MGDLFVASTKFTVMNLNLNTRVAARTKGKCARTASDSPLDDVVTGDALDAPDRPLLARIDRMRLPVGERGLGEHAGLHGHLVLNDDFLTADRLRDAGQRVAHQGDDGDLHVGLSLRCWVEMKMPDSDPDIGWVGHDLKPHLAESCVKAGEDVAVVAFGADLVLAALDQNVSLEQVIDSSNRHGRR